MKSISRVLVAVLAASLFTYAMAAGYPERPIELIVPWGPGGGADKFARTLTPELEKRLLLDEAADRVFNFIQSMTMELQMMARACGKNNVHDLEGEDMRALTVEASAITGIPLAGTDTSFSAEAIAAKVAALLRGGEPAE